MRLPLVLLGVLLCAGSVLAASPELRVEIDVQREVREVNRKGEARLVRRPVGVTKPGDVLVYTLRYRNVGTGPAVGATLSDPIPDGTVLVPGSVEAAPAHVLYSLDGKTYSARPIVRRTNASGVEEEVDAPAELVRHIRVALPDELPAGSSGSTSFKVIVQ